MSIPISLIIDDSAPLINTYWWHVAESQNTDTPTEGSGEPIEQAIPVDFLRRFIEIVVRWGVGGKFSVLPYPAGLGPITQGWKGCDAAALNTWLDLVRQNITPQMDITPEILTHAKTIDLDSLQLLPENERDWSRHQSASTMTPYISYALEILNAAGLEATGVTSPWDFGIAVESEYQLAIRAAMEQVNKCSQSWYFLHQEKEKTEFNSRVVYRREMAWQVSLFSQVSDFFWQTMNERATGTAYVRSVADAYLSEDGSSGRLAELFYAGTPIVWCTHWQSLFSNGRMSGLQALDEVCRRIDSLWGGAIEWMKCYELATLVAGGRTHHP